MEFQNFLNLQIFFSFFSLLIITVHFSSWDFCLLVFWPCLMVCRILVPQPGIEPGPMAVKVPS